MEKQVSLKFGMWTVVDDRGRYSLCLCDCGVERLVASHDLKAGKSKGCGCERNRRFGVARGAQLRTHGMTRRTEFQVWTDMNRRCHDPRRPDFKNYGARGIAVCEEWRNSFEAFYRDMGERPDGCTLDRMNNSGPYSKQNCIWAPRKTQERNKRTSRVVQVDGCRMTLAEAAEKYKVDYYLLHKRLGMGWPIERAIAEPSRLKNSQRNR